MWITPGGGGHGIMGGVGEGMLVCMVTKLLCVGNDADDLRWQWAYVLLFCSFAVLESTDGDSVGRALPSLPSCDICIYIYICIYI